MEQDAALIKCAAKDGTIGCDARRCILSFHTAGVMGCSHRVRCEADERCGYAPTVLKVVSESWGLPLTSYCFSLSPPSVYHPTSPELGGLAKSWGGEPPSEPSLLEGLRAYSVNVDRHCLQ